jgi:hypothetical protein
VRDYTKEAGLKMPENTKKLTDAELKQLGINRVPTDTYHVGPYKYSNLNDALAEAERSSAKHKSSVKNKVLKL